jgi:hypothetical protein
MAKDCEFRMAFLCKGLSPPTIASDLRIAKKFEDYFKDTLSQHATEMGYVCNEAD